MVRDKSERLVNLTTALLDSPRPLTFADIQHRLKGTYDQDDHETARRMFERDKKELRGLNIPVTTMPDLFTGVEGYTIDRSAYELEPIDLTVEEASALLAGVAMSGGTGERLAATRLTTDTPDSTGPSGPTGLALSLDGDHLDTVAAAVTTRTTISFDYRAGDGTPSRRTIDPWSVGIRNGVGYVLGHDHDRDDRRVFRLSRIASTVRTTGEPGAFEPPPAIDLAAELRGPFGDGTRVDLAVAPHAVAEVAGRGGEAVAPDGEAPPAPPRPAPSRPGEGPGDDAVPPAGTDGPTDRHDGDDRDDGGDGGDDPLRDWIAMVLPDADPVRLLGWLVTRADRVVVTAPADLRMRVHDHLADLVGPGGDA